MNQDIIIRNVDPAMLDRQRLTLQRAIGILRQYMNTGSKEISCKDVEALEGIQNMLDDWSDRRFRGEDEMQDTISFMGMARIACATVPDTVVDELDISDEEFIRLRDKLHQLSGTVHSGVSEGDAGLP